MRNRSTKERKKDIEEFVYKYEKEISELMNDSDFSSNYWKEKCKQFIWTKVKTEITYSCKTYYIDIYLNIRRAYERLFSNN